MPAFTVAQRRAQTWHGTRSVPATKGTLCTFMAAERLPDERILSATLNDRELGHFRVANRAKVAQAVVDMR